MSNDDVVDRLISFNRDREPERLKIKLGNMAADPFAFFRGTCHLFYEDWPAATELDQAPAAWVCGDLHLENFGSYKGDNRLTYFDINDFDESALAPLTWDLTRLVTSLRLAAKLHEIPPATLRVLERACLAAYRKALLDGKARWIERATAEGMVSQLLAAVKDRKRKEFLDHRTELKGRQRVLRDLDGKTLPIAKQDLSRVDAAMRSLAGTKKDAAFFQMLDAKRRVAGTGNLGLGRYVVLVEGHGSPDENYLIDLKENHPSALEPRLTHRQPDWPSPAARVVALQHRLQAIAPALLSAIDIAEKSWTLRELQPVDDRVEISRKKPGTGDLELLVGTFGALTAWAHLRSSGRDGSANADALIEFADRPGWSGQVRAFAKVYARKVREDWKAFCEARKKGAFADLTR